MSNIQSRYLRHTLAAWVVLVFLYSATWWMMPFSYGSMLGGFLLVAFVYGLWYFRG